MRKVLGKNLGYSTSLIYLQGIVLPQLKKQSDEFAKWGTTDLKPKFKEFFEKNPDKKFTIKIMNDEMSAHFIKVIKEYCQKDLGKDDMFNIVIF